MAPIPGSMFNTVPNGVQAPALPPQVGGPPGSAGAGGAPPGMSPGGGPPGTTPPGVNTPQEMDLFQRVATLMMADPKWVHVFAGMGLREALEKSGKYQSKGHRSNAELAAEGQDVGIPGQTGVMSPDQQVKQLKPPAIGPAGMPGF